MSSRSPASTWRCTTSPSEALAAAPEIIRGNLDRQVARGKITEAERDAALARHRRSSPTSRALGQTDLVIEAATEREALKHQIFKALVPHLAPHTILTSNTSSISITRLASGTDRPERFMGFHFMNPVPVMQLVELIRGIATDEPTYETLLGVVEKIGKTASASEDFPAFIVNRILVPMINEAVYTLYEGVGTVASIDMALKLGANHPMGPLELADFIGLDTCLAIMNVLHEGLADTKYRPCPLLVKYVEAGWLGRKTQPRLLRLPRRASRSRPADTRPGTRVGEGRMGEALAGKTALVTGASSGIGRALARALAAEGARLALAARSIDRLDAVRAGLAPAEAITVPTDSGIPAEVERMVTATLGHFGRIDILLAHAGVYVPGEVKDGDPAAWEQMIAVNVASVFRAIHAVLPGMIAQGSGHIVVTSSISGHSALRWEPVYSATKHAIQSFVHGLRRKVAPFGLRVGEVSPGIVLNELWGYTDPQVIASKAAAHEGLLSEDVADAVLSTC